MGRVAAVIVLSATERAELESLARAHKTGQAMARRARIVLAAAAGRENKAIWVAVGAQGNTFGKWRRRCAEHRMDGLHDAPRPGPPRKIGDAAIADKGPPHAGDLAARGDPLVVARHGQGGGLRALDDPPDLAGFWPSAPSPKKRIGCDVQSVDGPALCREGARHCRPLSVAARARPGSVRGRDVANSGA